MIFLRTSKHEIVILYVEVEGNCLLLAGPATSKATANMISAGPSDLRTRTAEDRWNPSMSGKKILEGKVMIGIESNASTTRRTTTETSETQENATASKAATAANATTAGMCDGETRVAEDRWNDSRNDEAGW